MGVRELLREIAAGSLSGMAVGIVVGGLGSRLVMRFSAIAAGGGVQGVTTANGNRVGEITVGGTIALIVFAGVFTGILGGLLYTSLRPWLAPFARWRGLIFGLGLLGLAGSLVLDQTNSDFIILRPPLLNVAMFAALFVIFGVALPPAFDRTLRKLADGSLVSDALTFLGLLLAGLVVGTGLVAAFDSLTSGPTTLELISVLTLGVILAGLASRALGQRLASPAWRLASYALLVAVLLVGAAYTYGSVVRILT
jgi:hypothetical protein